MKKDIAYYERIDAYLNDLMSLAEKSDFEIKIKNDVDLKTEINLRRDLLLGIQKHGESALNNKLYSVEKKLSDDGFFDLAQSDRTNIKKTISRRGFSLMNRRSLSIAASLLFIISLTVYFQSRSDLYDQAFAANFHIQATGVEYVLEELESSGFAIPDKVRRNQLSEALQSFEKGNYNLTLSLLEEHLITYSDDDDARFYYAVTLMHKEKIKASKEQLTKLININSARDKEARWYFALCHLKRKRDHLTAKMLFTNIAADKDSPFQLNASKLLVELKEY